MAVDIIARAMAANASSGGGSSSDFPIIDATGDTEVDLDNYLEEGTWFIKGNNVKQMKISVYEFVQTAPSAILTIRTVDGATYQSLEFPDLAYSSSTGYHISNYIGARKIKPSIDERFQFFGTPTRITNNYTSGIFNDAQSHAFSQSGANELYTEIREAIGQFGTSYGLAKLTKLKTTNKKSLVNAINELVDIKQDKLTAGDGITIENNVISASGGIPSFVGTQDNPITLTSNDIVKEPICLISGYIVDSPVYNNRNIEDTLILYNLTDRDTIGQWRRKTQVIYLGYSSLTNIFTAFCSYTRDIQLGTSSDLWSVNRDWRYVYCNYEYSQYYESAMPGLQLFNQKGAHNMYIELMSYLTNNINNKPRLTNLTTTDKTSLIAAINEINAKIPSGTLATNLAEVQGYDATKTQVLKNINGQFTWVDES